MWLPSRGAALRDNWRASGRRVRRSRERRVNHVNIFVIVPSSLLAAPIKWLQLDQRASRSQISLVVVVVVVVLVVVVGKVELETKLLDIYIITVIIWSSARAK